MDNKIAYGLLEKNNNEIKLNSTKSNLKAYFKSNPDFYDNVKSKVYYDPSETTDTDDLIIKNEILNFVADGLKFDQEVVKTKAAYALPYSEKYVEEIFENKTNLGNDICIQLGKYKVKNENSIKFVNKLIKDKIKQKQKLNKIEEEKEERLLAIADKSYINKFKPKSYFVDSNLSKSDSKLNEDKTNEIGLEKETNLRKSLNDLNEENHPSVFLTEAIIEENSSDNDKIERKSIKVDQSKSDKQSQNNYIKDIEEKNWDDYLIDSLSENTARWIVMKRVTDPKQREKLLAIVENKFGRYTRNIKDLELFEDSLTDFEKRKIQEEKERLKAEKESKEKLALKQLKSKEEQEKEQEKKKEDQTPIYRLPQGIKRIELKKLEIPDPNYNKTARDIKIEPVRVLSPRIYTDKMKDKNITDMSLYKSDIVYTNEMLAGTSKHLYAQNENLIFLENGKTFSKSLEPVYPKEFTDWLNGVNVPENDKPELKKPIRGKKKWKKFPELIDDYKINKPSEAYESEDNYWHLMPTTPDTELRKVLKSNLTLAKIVDEWRRQWQKSNKWTLAEVDQLINDMKHEQANVRFQALVVCSRAVEQFQLLIDKLASYNKKYKNELDDEFKELYKQSSDLMLFRRNSAFANSADSSIKSSLLSNNHIINDIILSEKLFDSIESLLNDKNTKVRLAAAIAIFTIHKKFIRPFNEKHQLVHDTAETILRETLNSYNKSDKYAAALCLANDGYCNKLIVEILIYNYFESNEQFTKEQVTQCLSDLSLFNDIIISMIDMYLDSKNVRERILSCKLLPCLHSSLNKNIVSKLINLMWNDMNKSVKKVAAQTLGRTGRGKDVHDEIYERLKSTDSFDRISALNVINHIGIMTPKLLPVYLKCFRDDYISVRELACKSCQKLYEKDDKLIESLVYMSRFDRVPKLKALAIRTLGLIGEYSLEIKRSLMWALQFELDPLIRTEACHSIVLLSNQKDQELIDLLLERHLVEEESTVRNEIKEALEHLGYDPNKELPIVAKIKSDIKKLNDKNEIIKKIIEIEKKSNFEIEKNRLIWNENEKSEKDKKISSLSIMDSIDSFSESFGPFEPRIIEKSNHKIKSKLNVNIKEKKLLNNLSTRSVKEPVKNLNLKKKDKNDFLSKIISANDSKEMNSSFSSFNFDSNSIENYLNENENLKSPKKHNLGIEHEIDSIVEERN